MFLENYMQLQSLLPNILILVSNFKTLKTILGWSCSSEDKSGHLVQMKPWVWPLTPWKLDILVYICDPSTQEAEQKQGQEFKVIPTNPLSSSLCYMSPASKGTVNK